MRFSPAPANKKENIIENERVDTFWSSKNTTKDQLEPRKMKPKDI